MKMRSTVATAALLCLVAGDGLAQEKQQVSFKSSAENNKITQSYNVEVGDVPNHIVGSHAICRGGYSPANTRHAALSG
jgi:hypothetical protein